MTKAHELLDEGDRGVRGAARLLRDEKGSRSGDSLPKSGSRRASSLLKDESARPGSDQQPSGGARALKMGKRDAARLSRKLRNSAAAAAALAPEGGDGASSSGDDAAARAAKASASMLGKVRARRALRKGKALSAGGAAGAGREGSDAAARVSGGSKAPDAASRKAAEKLERERRHALVRAAARRKSAAARAVDAVQAKLSATRTAAAKTGAAVAAGAGGSSAVGIPLALVVIALAVAVAVGAVIGEASRPKDGPLEGFPPYITASMVRAALRCQEDYGHPAGCTIAQIIAESGMGDTMSQLAVRDHNLFGMKWSVAYEGEPEVAGHASWGTGEEYEPGQITQVTAEFIVFKSDEACITFRSRVFLQGSRYAGNALIQQAIAEHSSDKMAEGLKDAGWATDSAYVEKLKRIMDEWGLRALDTMTVEEWEQQIASGGKGQDYDSATDAQKRIADQARIEPFAGGGWCAKWVCNVFDHTGIAAPRLPRASDYMKFCHARLDASAVKVGMIVVTPSSSTAPGIGHIGIYVGGGIIRSNEVGGVIERTIDDWLGVYAAAPSYVGWMSGIDLSAT